MVGNAPVLARTLVLPLDPAPGLMLQWPAADPLDVLDYCLDLSAWLTDAGETISSFAVAVTPADGSIQVVSSSVRGNVLVVRISGGISGTVYQVGLSVSLASGEMLHQNIALPVITLPAEVLSVIPTTVIVHQVPLTVADNDDGSA